MTEDLPARQAIGKLQSAFQEAAQKTALQQQQEQTKAILNVNKDLMSHTFEKAQAYDR